MSINFCPIKHKFLGSLLIIAASIFFSGLSPAVYFQEKKDEKNPRFWQVKIRLETEGSYRSRQKDASFFGYYTLHASCSGILTKDEDDFLLYPDDSFTEKWEAQETAVYPHFIKSITHHDFQQQPDLRLNYILKKGSELHFDVFVEGFPVPQTDSLYKMHLHLPASKENESRTSDINYDTRIQQGSNRISILTENIHKKAVSESFRWKWKQERWFLEPEATIFFSHFHNVMISVTVTPKYE